MGFNDFGDTILKKQAKFYGRPVFFAEDTAPEPGRVVCWDRTYTSSATGEAATDSCGYRGNRVKYPTATTNLLVAGVISHTAQGKSAKTGGQWVEMLVPGSVCEIRCDVPISALLQQVTAAVNAIPGAFFLRGFRGRGSALALQTIANVASNATNLIGPVFQTLDGTATYTSATKTVTKTGIGTNAAIGDRFVVIDAATTGAAANATPGEFIVATVPGADSVTLTTAPLAGDGKISGYLVRGKPRILAYLDEGKESGLIQFISVVASGAASANPMEGGVSFIGGGHTLAGVSTATLADASYDGVEKGIAGLGTLTTSGLDITVTSGLQADGATALAGIVIDAANEFVKLTFHGNFGAGTSGLWVVDGHAGATLAAT